jgi:peptidyl-tRNA hydrolase, PTH1 family
MDINTINKTTPAVPDFSKVKLIVGLGNVGDEYLKTRHNAGFLLLDQLATEPFTSEKKFKANVSSVMFGEQKIILAKPNTMMNNSGLAVRLLADYYKLWPKNICIAHDDLDIRLSEFKLQYGKGPKIHNGILSIEKYLSSKSFWRIRIGVDNRSPETRKNIRGHAYVLGMFSNEELDTLKTSNSAIIQNISS